MGEYVRARYTCPQCWRPSLTQSIKEKPHTISDIPSDNITIIPRNNSDTQSSIDHVVAVVSEDLSYPWPHLNKYYGPLKSKEKHLVKGQAA